mgnify:CR=1 FL=1
MSSADIVTHLAAVTGKARQEEYFNVNREGTKTLIEQCKNHKIKQFVLFFPPKADQPVADNFFIIFGMFFTKKMKRSNSKS